MNKKLIILLFGFEIVMVLFVIFGDIIQDKTTSHFLFQIHKGEYVVKEGTVDEKNLKTLKSLLSNALNQLNPYYSKIGSNRICTPKERTNHMQNMCQTLAPADGLYNPRFIKQPNLNVIVDNKHQLLFCYIPKSSSSTWLRLLVNASDPALYAEALKRESMKGQEINPLFHGIYLEKAGLTTLKSWNSSYENYTKFIVVRHPLDRLLSAYYDKICRQDLNSWLRALKKLFLQANYSKDLSTNNCLVSFEDFVHFVTAKNYRFSKNQHWNSYSNMCDACHIKYDYILRLETIIHDAGPVLNKLGLSSHHLSDKFHQNKNRSKQSSLYKNKTLKSAKYQSESSSNYGVKILDDYNVVNKTNLERIADLYKQDMTIFGYHFNANSFEATCNIPTEQGDYCC